MSFFRRSQKEKRIHYTQVANGTKSVKQDSKFTPEQQIAYARGQRDARNEAARITAYKNSTTEQRKAYKEKKAAERKAYLERKAALEAEKKQKAAKKAAARAAKKKQLNAEV